MNHHALFVAIVGVAATLGGSGCSASVDSDASPQSSTQDVSAAGAGREGAVQFLCPTGPGSLEVDQVNPSDPLALNAALLFAYEEGGTGFEACNRDTAMSLENPQVASLGPLKNIPKSIKWIYRNVPFTRKAIRAAKSVSDSVSIWALARDYKGIEALRKAGISLKQVRELDDVIVINVAGKRGVQVLASKFTDEVTITRRTTGLKLSAEEFTKLAKEIYGDRTVDDLRIIVQPRTNTNRSLGMGMRYPAPKLRPGEFIASYELEKSGITYFTAPEVVRFLENTKW